MSDDELQTEIMEELRSEPAALRARIQVRASGGRVTLSGQVSSFSEKQKLDAAVLRVAGIKALDTQISIRRFAEAC